MSGAYLNCLWCFTFESAMLSCPWKLSASRLTISSMPRTVLPNFAYAVEQTACSTSSASLVKNISPLISLGLLSSFKGLHLCRALHEDIYPMQVKSDAFEEPNLTIIDTEDSEEIQTQEKVSHGNKGRIPWNKGQTHSEETRERIRRRTKEALKDPKIRKKMSESPRALSNQTKAKIRASLTKLWGKRLKWRRSREKFLRSWVESIAKAAKLGGSDEQELDWDSYDKLKQEIALLQIQHAAERAKAREMARLRAERAAQVKAEKMVRRAQRRREREENAKVRGESVRKRNKKSKEEKEKLAEFQGVKLKERLMKIHKKKSTINRVSNQHQRPWDKFDMEFEKGEQPRKEISLADQIRFAKKRRAQQLVNKHC